MRGEGRHHHRPGGSPIAPQCRSIRYRVRRRDLASRIYWSLGRARRKPAVLATARLMWLCELAVMSALPGVSLGTSMTVEHLAPAVRGALVTVTAVCLQREGQYWDWRVEVRDGHELLARCTLRFVADLDTHRYRRRLNPKLAARRCVGWLCLLDLLALIVALANPLQVVYLWRYSVLGTELLFTVGWLVSLSGLPDAVSDWLTVRRGLPRHRLPRR